MSDGLPPKSTLLWWYQSLVDKNLEWMRVKRRELAVKPELSSEERLQLTYYTQCINRVECYFTGGVFDEGKYDADLKEQGRWHELIYKPVLSPEDRQRIEDKAMEILQKLED